MSEMTSESELTRRQPARDGSDGVLAAIAWRRRFDAIRTNEFINEFVTTCVLSVLAFGPIPPVRMRRNH